MFKLLGTHLSNNILQSTKWLTFVHNLVFFKQNTIIILYFSEILSFLEKLYLIQFKKFSPSDHPSSLNSCEYDILKKWMMSIFSQLSMMCCPFISQIHLSLFTHLFNRIFTK